MDSLDRLINRVEQLINRAEQRFLPSEEQPDWNHSTAWRWNYGLEAIPNPHQIQLDDLLGIDRQKAELERNTRQFVNGHPANNALLWGARGTGKSSLVKALLTQYAPQGLRVIEVEGHDLLHLPQILAKLYGQNQRFILYSDDLSFAADDRNYRVLKATLEGSLSAVPDNVLIYATSNRRHLMPEFMSDNRSSQMINGELHPNETIEEQISLSERFGLWLAFHSFNQDQYLAVVDHWLKRFGTDDNEQEKVHHEALQWALKRGSRNGRVAWHFARDWVGKQALDLLS